MVKWEAEKELVQTWYELVQEGACTASTAIKELRNELKVSEHYIYFMGIKARLIQAEKEYIDGKL